MRFDRKIADFNERLKRGELVTPAEIRRELLIAIADLPSVQREMIIGWADAMVVANDLAWKFALRALGVSLRDLSSLLNQEAPDEPAPPGAEAGCASGTSIEPDSPEDKA